MSAQHTNERRAQPRAHLKRSKPNDASMLTTPHPRVSGIMAAYTVIVMKRKTHNDAQLRKGQGEGLGSGLGVRVGRDDEEPARRRRAVRRGPRGHGGRARLLWADGEGRGRRLVRAENQRGSEASMGIRHRIPIVAFAIVADVLRASFQTPCRASAPWKPWVASVNGECECRGVWTRQAHQPITAHLCLPDARRDAESERACVRGGGAVGKRERPPGEGERVRERGRWRERGGGGERDGQRGSRSPSPSPNPNPKRYIRSLNWKPSSFFRSSPTIVMSLPA